MKKVILFLLFLCPFFAVADDLNDILDGKYKPILMSVEEQDSILAANSACAQNPNEESSSSHRWRLEYENKQPLYRHSFLGKRIIGRYLKMC